MFYRRLLFAAVAFLTGCGKQQPATTSQRLAVLRFENLTPDADLNWEGRAASEMLIRELGAVSSRALFQAGEPFSGRTVGAPGVSAELTNARLAGATRVISGSYSQVKGNMEFTAVEQDLATGKTLQAASASGPLLSAVPALARQFNSSPKPYSAKNEEALKNYALGIESPPDSAAQYYERAVAADPDFFAPYLAWADLAVARKNEPEMERILTQARTRSLPSSEKAKLELAAATLESDPQAKLKALGEIVQVNPADVSALRELGQAELATHRFTEAAAHFTQAAEAAPEQPALWNLAAYSRMFGGDSKGALDAIRRYQKLRPDDPNGPDSEGDIQFFFGSFREAEMSYQRAAAQDPAFNQGTDLWKAARARLMTGDVAGAGEIFGRYQSARVKAKDPAADFRAAEWPFLIGDRPKGLRMMEALADSASTTAIKQLASTQAAIWDLQAGRAADAIRHSTSVLQGARGPDFVPAALVRFAALSPAPVAEWRQRSESQFHGAGVEPFRSLAVGYALFFQGKFADAVPVLKQSYESSHPTDQNVAFVYAAALAQSGQLEQAAPLLKGNPIPQSAAAPSFECLYFPRLLEWRGDRQAYLKLAGTPTPPK